MRPLHHQGLVTLTFLAGAACSAQAESLRCNGQSSSEGDTRLSVLYKCGQPLLADHICAPVLHAPSQQFVPGAWVGVAVPCTPIEQWVYDRGPGNLMATVRFRAGVVQSISYGRSPQ